MLEIINLRFDSQEISLKINLIISFRYWLSFSVSIIIKVVLSLGKY
jgi:hypothetical protein